MRKIIISISIIGLLILSGLYAKRKFYDPKHRVENTKRKVSRLADNNEIKNGDLIFQTSLLGQSKAIQIATKSKYSYCGIIYSDNGKFYVFEAVHPAKTTPLDKWIARGEDGHFVIKRFKNADQVLIAKTLQKITCERRKI